MPSTRSSAAPNNTRQRRRPTAGGDVGAALVEFVMVAVLLLFLLFAVLQVAAIFYVRNVIAASAADGAHYAASVDVDPDAGGVRANRLIADALSSSAAGGIVCTSTLATDAGSGISFIRVECVGRVRSIFLPVGRFVAIDVVSHSVKEAA